MWTTTVIEHLREKQAAKQRNPVLFAKEVIGYDPDHWQADTLRDLADLGGSVSVPARAGKTATEAIVLMWFLACFIYARVVATAPTLQQLNDVLWFKVAKW